MSGREICGGKGIWEGGWTYTEAPPYCKPTGFKAHTHKKVHPSFFPPLRPLPDVEQFRDN